MSQAVKNNGIGHNHLQCFKGYPSKVIDHTNHPPSNLMNEGMSLHLPGTFVTALSPTIPDLEANVIIELEESPPPYTMFSNQFDDGSPSPSAIQVQEAGTPTLLIIMLCSFILLGFVWIIPVIPEVHNAG